ncbi:hypothetical protein TrLO_g9160 [Triparma laevis f. longispina]|uniref:Kinesin light chain n=1 Tax=Triparma laevis f. longispina TaxID=1714387 RepID=A0A9W7KSM8_9STRA|nr:hypothetical protein TrLO_g9160 [Triparma laevis f. longispina]
MRALGDVQGMYGGVEAKTLDVTKKLVCMTCSTNDGVIEKFRDLVKRMDRALGEENVVILETLKVLGSALYNNGEYEEAKEVYEKCLAGRLTVLGEQHKDTLGMLNNLGIVYDQDLKNNEKALEYYERALGGNRGCWGRITRRRSTP